MSENSFHTLPRGLNMFVFVGERRSRTAVENNWTWKDGHLAAKPLFNALLSNGVNPDEQTFINIFYDGDGPETVSSDNLTMILSFAAQEFVIVGMGQKVHQALSDNQVGHIHIVHPAARGKIRATEVYTQHIKDQLGL